MRVEFKYGGKKYVVETKPMDIEVYKKFIIGSSSLAARLEKVEELLTKCEDLDQLDRLIAMQKESEQDLLSMPPGLGQLLTEAVSIDGKKLEGPLSVGEYTCIGTVITRTAVPSEEDLKNLAE